MTKPLYHQFN